MALSRRFFMNYLVERKTQKRHSERNEEHTKTLITQKSPPDSQKQNQTRVKAKASIIFWHFFKLSSDPNIFLL